MKTKAFCTRLLIEADRQCIPDRTRQASPRDAGLNPRPFPSILLPTVIQTIHQTKPVNFMDKFPGLLTILPPLVLPPEPETRERPAFSAQGEVVGAQRSWQEENRILDGQALCIYRPGKGGQEREGESLTGLTSGRGWPHGPVTQA